MTNKPLVLVALALCALPATGVNAASGSQAFADIGIPMADGSATGNINTATSFLMDELVSTRNNSGVFAGMPTQTFMSVMFNHSVPTSIDFGNSVFGQFASTSIVEEATSHPGFVLFLAMANWTPGSYAGFSRLPRGTLDGSLRISFTQTPEMNGTISNSATFALGQQASVPEPSSLVMLLTGFAALVIGYPLRRRPRDSAMA